MNRLFLTSIAALFLATGTAILPYARAGEGIEDGVPCHDFSGAEYNRCTEIVTYCQRSCKYNAPFENEKAKACYYSCLADKKSKQITTRRSKMSADKEFERCMKLNPDEAMGRCADRYEKRTGRQICGDYINGKCQRD
jgi:hypothetical protein